MKKSDKAKALIEKKLKQQQKQAEILVKIKDHKDKNGGHPHVILEDIDDKHVSVGLSTKNKKGKNHPNKPLTKSPLNDGKYSYARRQGTVDNKSNYYKPRQGEMPLEDYEIVKRYGNRAKEKYLRKKNNDRPNT